MLEVVLPIHVAAGGLAIVLGAVALKDRSNLEVDPINFSKFRATFEISEQLRSWSEQLLKSPRNFEVGPSNF
jgi:hypothetical protein